VSIVTAYIGVGSNINPEENIQKAFLLLKDRLDIVQVSRLYRSTPVGGRNQAPFVNGVWKIETSLSPPFIKFNILRKVEQKLGRVRTQDKYADRTIDMDLILYGKRIIQSIGLTLPDEDILKRDFIYIPLLELDPEIKLPGFNKKLKKLVCDKKDTLKFLPGITERIKGLVKAKP
jgi:2-amino-4-hydroxy-6-hydroxymethyldihydropteridine diphosphokinase